MARPQYHLVISALSIICTLVKASLFIRFRARPWERGKISAAGKGFGKISQQEQGPSAKQKNRKGGTGYKVDGFSHKVGDPSQYNQQALVASPWKEPKLEYHVKYTG